MGTLVRFESTRLLLQREDFPAAWKALKKSAGAWAPPERLASATGLVALLEALDLRPTLDAHGDLVALAFEGDRAPVGAPDEYPENLVVALKKLLRESRFDLTLEGAPRVRRTSIDRGQVRSQDVPRRVRFFRQLSPPPRLTVGGTAEILVRYVSTVDGDDAAVDFKVSDGGEPLSVRASTARLSPGGEATVTVHVPPARPVYRADAIAAALYGDGAATVRGHAELFLDPDGAIDDGAEVIASEVVAGSGDLVGGRAAPLALEDLRRFAARVTRDAARPLAARVGASADLASALEVAGFTVERAEAGVRSVRFERSMPWREDELLSMLRAFAPRTSTRGARVRRAFESDPGRWVTFLFEPGRVERLLEERRAPD